MDDTHYEFENITLIGRLCYLFMCIEKYLVSLYPHQNWLPIAKRMWQWTKQEYWEIGLDIYDEVVPEYIFEFDTYEETNIRTYDGNLKKEDYDEITACFKDITSGNPKDEICQVLMMPSKFGNECECCNSFFDIEPYTLNILNHIRKILCSYNISLPDITLINTFSFNRNKSNERERWGKPVDAKYLSIILN